MTFGPHHYVPVLKVKPAEKAALRKLSADIRWQVTPLLEIVERKGNVDCTVESHLNKAFKDLADCVRPFRRCFLDAHEIAPDGCEAATAVFERASMSGIVFTPVTGVSRVEDVTAALGHATNGIALRLTRQECEEGRLFHRINSFMSQYDLDAEQTDLILDLGAVDNLIVEGIYALTEAFMGQVPHLAQWRTLTLSACAFPSSMGGVERNSHKLVDRADWIAWRRGCFERRQTLVRLPTYSDCAIQHPEGVEGFDPSKMRASASIRYTKSDDWLLIKGESTRMKLASEQFPDMATQLVYGNLKAHFAGDLHCAGCASIKYAADGAPNYGSAEVWRRLGTIHHITQVVQELDALSWP